MHRRDPVVKELGLTSCKLVKIDAESAEMDVVQGALSTIGRLKPRIAIETGDSSQSGSTTRQVLDVLLAQGYLPYEFRDWELHPHSPKKKYGYQNLLLVHPECDAN
ncbi:MAG: FkbM family methyltransferase [Rhodospirillales bacterium]|nr:FkbM family methyltransferase [Rhodospirillales bacterium]